MRPRRCQQRLVREVVYVLVLLVAIDMILAVVGPTLATVVPMGPESEAVPASQAASQPASAPAFDAVSVSRPTPVAVLTANNLTRTDL